MLAYITNLEHTKARQGLQKVGLLSKILQCTIVFAFAPHIPSKSIAATALLII